MCLHLSVTSMLTAVKDEVVEEAACNCKHPTGSRLACRPEVVQVRQRQCR
jgi:hypothetical protein